MNKQQFLAMSLPHDLAMKSKTFSRRRKDIEVLTPSNYNTMMALGRIPVLHSLRDLAKPITHKGETVVPIEKMELSELDPDIVTGWIKAELLIFKNSLKLIEWHFDIAGLIEKGEAIDVNTLEINLYK